MIDKPPSSSAVHLYDLGRNWWNVGATGKSTGNVALINASTSVKFAGNTLDAGLTKPFSNGSRSSTKNVLTWAVLARPAGVEPSNTLSGPPENTRTTFATSTSSVLRGFMVKSKLASILASKIARSRTAAAISSTLKVAPGKWLTVWPQEAGSKGTCAPRPSPASLRERDESCSITFDELLSDPLRYGFWLVHCLPDRIARVEEWNSMNVQLCMFTSGKLNVPLIPVVDTLKAFVTGPMVNDWSMLNTSSKAARTTSPEMFKPFRGM